MKRCTLSRPLQKECHITDIFFRSELDQLAGSDAGDRWFHEQSRGATFNQFCHVHNSNPSSPQPKPEASPHRPAEPDSPKADCKLPNQDIPNPKYLSMDEDTLYHLGSSMLYPCKDCVNDFGLLFTDAAHTVLARLGSRP